MDHGKNIIDAVVALKYAFEAAGMKPPRLRLQSFEDVRRMEFTLDNLRSNALAQTGKNGMRHYLIAGVEIRGPIVVKAKPE